MGAYHIAIIALVAALISAAHSSPRLKHFTNNTAFHRLTAEENRLLQQACENPDFSTTGEAQKKVMHGVPVPPGRYPWAVALTLPGGGVLCGATLISKRHVITARHCFEGPGGPFPDRPVRVMVGGVCSRLDYNDDCARVDMREVPIDFVAYRRPIFQSVSARGYETKTILRAQRYNIMHDLAVIQLAEDIPTQEVNSTSDVHFACLAREEMSFPLLGSSFFVYGWGMTEKGYGAAHLREVELPLMGDDDEYMGRFNRSRPPLP